MYKHYDIVQNIHDVLLEYESNLEAMCDCATFMLTQLIPNIQIFVGYVNDTVNDIPHVWAYDTKEKYYIDITSKQFGFSEIICSQDIQELSRYIISDNVIVWDNMLKHFDELSNGPVIIHHGEEVTMKQLLSKIKKPVKTKKKGWFFGGTRRT